MSDTPKLATEDQVKSVADTFTELYNHQGKQIKSIESGIIDTIVPSSPAPTKRGQYVVAEPGIYVNFKDSDNQPISVTEEEFTSGAVYLVYNGTNSRKVVVPIEANGKIEEKDNRPINGNEVYTKFKDVGLTNSSFQNEDFNLGYYNLTGDEPSDLLASTQTLCIKIEIKESNKLFLDFVNGGTNSRAYAFVDADNKIIERANPGEKIYNTSFDIPSTAAYVYINSTFGSNPDFKNKLKVNLYLNVSVFKDKIDEIGLLNNKIDSLYKQIVKGVDFELGYYNLTGEAPSLLLSSSVTYATIRDVQEGSKVLLEWIYGGTNSRAYAFVDADNKIIERAIESDRIEKREILAPIGSVKIYVNSTNYPSYPREKTKVTIIDYNYSISTELAEIKEEIKKIEPVGDIKIDLKPFLAQRQDGFNGTKKTYSLAGTDVARLGDNFYTKGYFFTAYPTQDNKLYYSNSIFKEPELVYDFGNFATNIRSFAVSPKHRSIISNIYDGPVNNGIMVFDNGAPHTVAIGSIQGWLYNFGYCFEQDSSGNEFFMFGEYQHIRNNQRRIFKATYPYTDVNNWKVVHTFDSSENGEIHHIHLINKDPYSDNMYCFTGDNYKESNIYISKDYGETWQLLMKSTEIAPGTNAILRATNIIWLQDRILWASDDDYHVLCEMKRDSNGVLDKSTIRILTELKSGQMTNAMAYDSVNNCLYMMDRVRGIDSTLENYKFDLNDNTLIKTGEFTQTKGTNNILWGHRGRTYIVYPNFSDRVIGFGISNRITLQMNFPENDAATYGSLYYKI